MREPIRTSRDGSLKRQGVTPRRIESREQTTNVDTLVERVRGGDEQAGAILESLLLIELTRHAALLAPELSETDQELIAERGAQEAVRKIGRFDPGRATFATWARLQVRNQVSDFRRHPEHWGELPRDGWSAPASIVEELELDPENPERVSAKEREAEALAEVVGDLRPEDVEIMRLWSTGRTTAQIARTLGIKEGAVRTRHHRALARAKKLAAKRDHQGSTSAA